MASLLTDIQRVIPSMIFNSSSSSMPLFGRGKLSMRLPLRLTISTSMSITVFGVLYLASLL